MIRILLACLLLVACGRQGPLEPPPGREPIPPTPNPQPQTHQAPAPSGTDD